MGSWSGTACLAAVAASLIECATARARPDIHEDGWLLVETAHVSLHTDLERERAIARARQLEQYWQVLARTYGLVAPGAPPPPGRFRSSTSTAASTFAASAPELAASCSSRLTG